MVIKLGISPCGKNTEEAVMRKIIRIFGPKEINRKSDTTAPRRAGNVPSVDQLKKKAYKILVGKT